MAGDFNDDDIQYDDDELDEELDNDELDNDSLDEEDEELEAESKAQLEAEKTTVRNKLNKLAKDIRMRFIPILTHGEKRTIEKAKAIKMNAELTKVTTAQLQAWQTFWQKMQTVIASAGPVLVVMGVILLIIIAVIAVLSTIMPWLFETSQGGANKTMGAQSGVNGADFYGTRVVYRDDDKARGEILSSYDTIINDIVLDIEGTNLTDATLDVTINMPTDYDWENFDETAYSTDYASHYDLVKAIALIANEYDAVDDTLTLDSLTLTQMIDNIAHFGFSTDMITPIADKIKEYLSADGVVVVNSTDPEAPNIDTTTIINDAVDEYVNAELAVQTEKYFIKDYIFESEKDMMKNIPTANYVSMTFMAKKPVTFNSFSFLALGINDDFNIKIVNDSQEYTLTKAEFFTTDDGDTTWQYSSNANLNISTDMYQYLGDLDLSKGTSLLAIANTSTDKNNYLKSIDESVGGPLTYLDTGVRVTFDSENPFNFSEWETMWSK